MVSSPRPVSEAFVQHPRTVRTIPNPTISHGNSRGKEYQQVVPEAIRFKSHGLIYEKAIYVVVISFAVVFGLWTAYSDLNGKFSRDNLS